MDATGAAALSIASLGFKGGSKILGGIGEKESQDWLAARDERAAGYGRLKSVQTDTHLLEESNRTRAAIDSVRSAASTDPFSPTAVAVKDEQMRIADRDRITKVNSLLMQAEEDEASAKYRRSVGKFALLGGVLGGLGSIGMGLAPALGGGSSSPAWKDPRKIGSLY